MLAHHRKPVCLSFLSTDLPILASVETAATLYQKDKERFHLLLSQPATHSADTHSFETSSELSPDVLAAEDPAISPKQLLWLELSPYRVIMTMQENGLGYRHFWEQGVYGTSRFWLHRHEDKDSGSFRLHNFTRSLTLEGSPLPEKLRIDYELWSEKVQLGHYVLHLEIRH